MLVHSHRQRRVDFEAHARALGLASARAAASVLRRASLLLVNNNAAEVFKRASFGRTVQHGPTAEDPVSWLRAYGNVPFALRMVLTTSLNLGYFCGEVRHLELEPRSTHN